MSASAVYVALNVAFALFALGQLATRPKKSSRRSDRSANEWHAARVRIASVGPESLVAQRQVLVRIAPTDLLATALEATPSGDTRPTRIGTRNIADLRIWLRGRLAAQVVDPDEQGTDLRPLDAQIAGWELEVITRSGSVLRCYGAEVTPAIEQDLARLRRLLAVRTRPDADAAETASSRQPRRTVAAGL